MNKALFSGAIQSMELKYSEKGVPYARFTIAGSEVRSGNTLTSVVGATLFGKQAEFVAEHYQLDDAVTISGRLSSRTVSENGLTRTYVNVIAETVAKLADPELVKGQYGMLLVDCVNEVTVEGNLTREVTIRQTQGGSNVSRSGLAINHYNPATRETETVFVNIEGWNEVSTALAQLAKGATVQVRGRYYTHSWLEEDGVTKRYEQRLNLEAIQPIERVKRAVAEAPEAKTSKLPTKTAKAAKPVKGEQPAQATSQPRTQRVGFGKTAA